MDWGIVLGIIGVVGLPLAFIGIGISLIMGSAPTRGEFIAARACFSGAAGVPALGLLVLLWNYPEGSPVLRVVIAAIFGAIICGGLAAALDWVNRKENPPIAAKNDPALLIECHAGGMPTSPDRIYVLNLFPTPKENGGGGLAEYFSFDEKKGDRIWP